MKLEEQEKRITEQKREPRDVERKVSNLPKLKKLADERDQKKYGSDRREESQDWVRCFKNYLYLYAIFFLII